MFSLKNTQRSDSDLTQQHLLHYYVVEIRPILECCSLLWAYLPKYLSDQFESIEKRAIKIISNATIGVPYIFALTYS